MTENSQNLELARLRAEIEQQKAETAALRDELSRLQTHQLTPPNSATTSRRRMLRRLGMAATGVAAASMLAGSVNTAEAATNGNFILGRNVATNAPANDAQNATELRYTSATNPTTVFMVQAGTVFSPGSAFYTSASAGWTNGSAGIKNGMYGYTSTTGGKGVIGRSDGTGPDANGVEGISDTGFGVFGTGAIAGIAGQSENLGVYGISTNGYGGSFFSTNSLGILAGSANNYGGSFNGGKAPIFLAPSASSFPNGPTTGAHNKGELIVDSNGILFACVTSGTPGLWRKLAGAATAGSLHILPSPERMIDTRTALVGTGDPTGQLIGFDPATTPAAANIFNYTLTGRPGANGIQIPAGATAITGNITVIASASLSGGGFAVAWPQGGAVPAIATLNYRPGQIADNSLTVGLSATGKVSLASFKTVDVVIDIVGYYL